MADLLPILPSRSSYSEEARASSTMFRVEGGRPRGRLDIDEPASVVSCGWRLRAGKFGQLVAFYRDVTESAGGPRAFEADLLIDGPGLSRYSAQFVPGTFMLEAIEGGTYVVSAKLEVQPVDPTDAEYDAAIVMLFEAYGSGADASDALDLMSELVNEDLP